MMTYDSYQNKSIKLHSNNHGEDNCIQHLLERQSGVIITESGETSKVREARVGDF